MQEVESGEKSGRQSLVPGNGASAEIDAVNTV